MRVTARLLLGLLSISLRLCTHSTTRKADDSVLNQSKGKELTAALLTDRWCSLNIDNLQLCVTMALDAVIYHLKCDTDLFIAET